MAVRFNSLAPLPYVYRLESQSNTISLVASDTQGVRDFSIFPGNHVQAGDALLFLQSNAIAGKYQGLVFDISEALVAADISGIWEYARFDPQVNVSFGARWEPLQHVRDDTDSFQKPGVNTVTWEVPEDWENHLNPQFGHSGTAQYYHWYVRFRITSLSGLSQSGRQSSAPVQVKSMMLDLSNEGRITLDEIYAYDKSGQVDLDRRLNITSIDSSPRTFSDFLRPADYRVLGGAGRDLWVEVSNYSGLSNVEIIVTGTDVNDDPQSETIVISRDGVYYLAKYYKTLHESTVSVVNGTGNFDYKVIMGQLGVVYKTGNSQFAFACTLWTHGVTVLTTKQEQILFLKNWYPKIRSKVIMGEVFSGDKVFNGSNWIFETEYGDASKAYIAVKHAEIYNSQFKFKELNGSTRNHGFWGGGLGQRRSQKIIDVYAENFRNFAFTHDYVAVIGAKGFGMHLETPGAICKGITCYGANHSVRPKADNKNEFMHQCDFSGALSRPVNPWQVTKLSKGVVDWAMDFVDCAWGAYKSTDKFSWRVLDEEPQNGQRAFEAYSILLNVNDVQGNPVSDAFVRLTDNASNEVLNLTTTNDGYIGLESGFATSATENTLIDSSKTWSNNIWRFYEVYLINGTGAGQRRIIQKGNTSTRLQVAPNFDIVPDSTTAYIIIPYVRTTEYVPDRTQPQAYKDSIIRPSNPYLMRISKAGYEEHSEKITIDSQVITTKVLKIKKSDFDGFNG